WSQGEIYGAKLKDNMLELASEPKTFTELPQKGHMEGPFVFERDGVYYMTYPHVANKTERLEYAVSDHPLGAYIHKGVIMDESAKGTWTNHHNALSIKISGICFTTIVNSLLITIKHVRYEQIVCSLTMKETSKRCFLL